MWGRQACKSVTIFATAMAAVSLFASNVNAMQTPEFPSCLVPQGTVKAHHETGVHGIVGDHGKYEGADTVYEINDNLAMQCFCPPNGAGIQTNWWMVKHMDKFEKEEHIKKGWIDVPTGSVWNLKNKPYLAKNISYSCLSRAPQVPTAPGESAPGVSAPGVSAPGAGQPGPGPGGIGGAESSAPGVSAPGLATTGSLLSIYQTALMGALFAAGGLLVKKGARS